VEIVSRLPSAFSIILGVLPSRIATAELVVPELGVSMQHPGRMNSFQHTKINTNNLALDLLLATS